MGQKVNPIGLRLGINRTWDSRWYAGKNDYGKLLHEDMEIRDELMKQLKQAAVSKIVIERPHKKCRVTIHSARPGVVIGKKGADIEKLRRKVAELTDSDVVINIVEIRKPELDAQLVAESIAQQLERRVAFRRAMKRAVQSAMRLGAEGIRINCSGRLGGAEIARMEWYREGRVPLHTLRADVDYGVATAFTTFGTCGVKVWIFKGEILEHDPMAQDKKMAEGDSSRPRRDVVVRPVRPEGDGAGTSDRASDRSRAPCADPSHEARRPGLDPRVSGRAGVEEAGRSPHGLRQGHAGIVGGAGQAGPGDLRDRRRQRADREGSALARRRQAADQDALRRAHRGVTDMAEMKVADIRAMSADQMEDAILNLKKERFNLRFQRATGQLENTSRLREARRDIARIKTIAAQQRAKKK